MATRFKVPASPSIHIFQENAFLGADFTSDASTVEDTKSPNTVNMTRSVPGKIRKRMGYWKYASFGDPIYGVHHLTTTDVWLIHAGTKLYSLKAPRGKNWVDADGNEIIDQDENNILFLTGDVADAVVYTGLAEDKSFSLELDQKLIILDGLRALIFDGAEVTPLDEAESLYIPILRINEEPAGGGVDYESLNLLSPKWEEDFYVDADHKDTKEFQMAFGSADDPLDEEVTVKVMSKDGDWVEKKQGVDFNVDRQAGKITFVTAPGQSPVEGADNVKIIASKTFTDYKSRINHCKFGALFGVNGASDRLFLSGNTDDGDDGKGRLYSYRNWDWYSEQYNPYYFPDTGYSQVGSDSTAVIGYSIINNYLATFKNGNEQAQSVLIREGDLVTTDKDGDGTEESSDPAFKLINTLQGVGALSPYCFNYLETEPMFLTRLGIYAITAQDITGEKYSQNRSYYLDGKLLKEPNLKNAFAYTFKDLYILCVNGHCYVLDGLQPVRTDKNKPYATRQYVGFYWDNVPATCMFEMNDELYFGSDDGNIYKFYTDEHNPESFKDYVKDADGNDSAQAITALWETADISEDYFYKNKSYRYIAIKCMPEVVSSVQIYGQRHGLWELVKKDTTSMKYFTFNYLDFARMSFSTDTTAKLATTKVRLKKLDHVRFRFINDEYEEPFGINDFAVEFTQTGNHKG